MPCMSMRPGILERMKSWSALLTLATRADSVSLSPNFISEALTVSFSLTIGTVPLLSSRSMVLKTALWRCLARRSSRVRSICATVSPCGSNPFCQVFIRIVCPTAAQACSMASSFGRCSNANLPIPRPTAPELTSMTSIPRSRSALT